MKCPYGFDPFTGYDRHPECDVCPEALYRACGREWTEAKIASRMMREAKQKEVSRGSQDG
jgi:hypothetical protein